MAHYLGNVKDIDDFKQKVKKPKRLLNRTLRTVKKYLTKEDVKFLENQMQDDNLQNTQQKAEVILIQI